VIVDGNLITGQNPQSSVTTAQQVLAALGTV
jgi:putative intracellular protease/amidase